MREDGGVGGSFVMFVKVKDVGAKEAFSGDLAAGMAGSGDREVVLMRDALASGAEPSGSREEP